MKYLIFDLRIMKICHLYQTPHLFGFMVLTVDYLPLRDVSFSSISYSTSIPVVD